MVDILLTQRLLRHTRRALTLYRWVRLTFQYTIMKYFEYYRAIRNISELDEQSEALMSEEPT